jgi:hypothetical protein
MVALSLAETVIARQGESEFVGQWRFDSERNHVQSLSVAPNVPVERSKVAEPKPEPTLE